MKNIDGDVIRVQDDKATQYIELGYKYCPKSEWKKIRSTTQKTEEKIDEQEIKTEKPRRKKRESNNKAEQRKSKSHRT